MRWWAVTALLFGLVSAVWAGPWEGFTALTVSDNGRYYATGGRQGELLWGDVATGEILGRWHFDGQVPVVSVAFGPSGSYLSAAALDGSQVSVSLGVPGLGPVQGAGLGDAALRWKAAAPLLKGVEADQGAFRAYGSADGTLSVVLEQGRFSWQAHGAGITGLAWGPGASFLVSCSIDGTLVLWNPATGIALGRL